ncbi:hypothetical protein [Pacificoceanicola onchidii]|uniref:hypothetical protein n=1 Tax=Pacificoceanicola onchidii TaxID=2562685 RepID=UPI0010A2EFDE|nr:hypothetical protein [Pacificoceanicola onchidii]
MSAIRDEIRAILREELSALLAEQAGPHVETVRIETSDDLTAFARHLLERLSTPDFASRVQSGEIRFALDRAAPVAHAPSLPAAPIPVGTEPKPVAPMLDQKLVTEADLARFGAGPLRVPQNARLTPLAKDEARRKGIRIERIET